MPTYIELHRTPSASRSPKGVLRAWESWCLLFWRRCLATAGKPLRVSAPGSVTWAVGRPSKADLVQLSSVEWCGTVGWEPCTYRSAHGARIGGKLSEPFFLNTSSVTWMRVDLMCSVKAHVWKNIIHPKIKIRRFGDALMWFQTQMISFVL